MDTLRLIVIITALPLALAGCGSDAAPSDADADSDTDTGSGTSIPDPGCNVADVVCPPTHPHPGGPCEGNLTCPYTLESGVWTYSCVEGVWQVDVECYLETCAPPLSESCDTAFTGTLEGAVVRLGPPGLGAFVPFSPNHVVRVSWGSQGSPMIIFRIDIDGIESPPDCVLARYLLTNTEAGSSEPTLDRIRLRCGQSLGVFAIVPFGDLACSPTGGELPVHLEVEIPGIGTGTADLVIAYGVEDACYG